MILLEYIFNNCDNTDDMKKLFINLIKPLIAEGKIIKLNEVSSVRNFKDDSYKVGDL